MTLRKHRLCGAIASALIMGTVGFAGTAAAQDSASPAPQQQPTELDRVEVTGSRIRQASIETSNPVIVMSREQIQKQGFTSVGDILQNITTTGSPAISRANALSSGEEVGGQYVDLRNLGPQRTLVLLDGKRLGIASNGYADLASIPTVSVERIEVLTDGASAIYGSDAIAGVINIITRKNFDGLEASGYVGQYGQGDGQVQTYNFLLGSTGERSAITFGAEYTKEKPVYARDRDFSFSGGGPWHPYPDLDPITGEIRANGWSGNTDVGRIRTSTGDWSLNPGADPGSLANYHAYGTGANFDLANPNQQMFLRTGIERRSVFATGSFDFTDKLRLNVDGLYTHRETLQQIAGYPFSSDSYNDGGRILWSADNVYNPFGEDARFWRRTSEVPRQTNNELTTYRFSASLEGAFDIGEKSWNWDVGYVYNQNKGAQNGTGNLFIPNARNALGASFIDADGVARCGTPDAVISGCIPWNPALPFGQAGAGGLTGNGALQDYLFLPTHDTSETTTHIYSLNLSGALWKLPAGDLTMAIGYEHRKEEARFEPDALKQSGLSTDLAGGVTAGGYSLDEFYLEFNVPILADKPFAKELTVDVAGRYSDYDTFGDTTKSKVGLKWRPIEDLLVRGTYATGFRAPTLGDLYGGSSQSFEFYTDPCDTSFGSAALNPAVAARCAADNVPTDFRQIASGGTVASGPNSQSDWPFVVTSNADLKPETSKSTTLGVVYSPSFVEGLDISLDWWKIKIEDVIAAETMTSILNRCYVLGIASSCGSFTRDTDGSVGTSQGEIYDATVSLVNGGYQETAGYDFNVRYRLPETSFGNLTIDWKTTYVDYWEYKRDNEAVTPVEQKNGWSVDGNAYFRTRSNLSLDWEYQDFGATWGVRYYSGLKEACAYDVGNAEYGVPPGGPECNKPNFSSPYTNIQPSDESGSNTFHDVQVRYNAPWNATIAIGANNLFDHEGNYLYTSPNSDFGMYGGFDIGRFVYMKYSQRF
ncbi:TonB-dependent receptor plug domain-containing protein [Luteimonas aquatica]|uniref:TonB-dependent receptor plug domain-containing protein n=1 Tax=Luteimonas aquatica TaxID=450364 RepID=UPI001F56958B|nr:TonB-dependent receptor [Luteimonas aquatica]